MKKIVLFFLCTAALAQTTINGGRTITGAWDASGAATTKACKAGTAAPVTCTVGECFFDTDATAGQNLYGCTATNTWTLLGDGGGGGGGYATIQDEGSALIQRTTLNFAGSGVTCADDTNRTTCTIPGLAATTMRQTWNADMGACDNLGNNKSWGSWSNDDANGASHGCNGSGDSIHATLGFSDAATGKRTFTQVTLPLNWSSTDPVDVFIWMRPNSYSGSEKIKFFVETACRADGESAGFSYNTAASAYKTVSESDTKIHSLVVSSIPVTNCAPGELMRVRLRRADSSDVDDTYDSKEAHVVAFQLRYRVTVD